MTERVTPPAESDLGVARLEILGVFEVAGRTQTWGPPQDVALKKLVGLLTELARLQAQVDALGGALEVARHWHEQLDYDEALNVIDAALRERETAAEPHTQARLATEPSVSKQVDVPQGEGNRQ